MFLSWLAQTVDKVGLTSSVDFFGPESGLGNVFIFRHWLGMFGNQICTVEPKKKHEEEESQRSSHLQKPPAHFNLIWSKISICRTLIQIHPLRVYHNIYRLTRIESVVAMSARLILHSHIHFQLSASLDCVLNGFLNRRSF